MASFTSRHHVVVAKVIRESSMDGFERSLLVDKFCLEFGNDNPRFNRHEFVTACFPEPTPLVLVDGHSER